MDWRHSSTEALSSFQYSVHSSSVVERNEQKVFLPTLAATHLYHRMIEVSSALDFQSIYGENYPCLHCLFVWWRVFASYPTAVEGQAGSCLFWTICVFHLRQKTWGPQLRSFSMEAIWVVICSLWLRHTDLQLSAS